MLALFMAAAPSAHAAYSVNYVNAGQTPNAAANQQQWNASGDVLQWNSVYQDNHLVSLAVPNKTYTFGKAINDGGTVAGTYRDLDGTPVDGIFLYSHGTYTDLGAPPGNSPWQVSVAGLNNQDSVIAVVYNSYQSASFLHDGGGWREICSSCNVSDINDAGSVVGSQTFYNAQHQRYEVAGFTYVNGVLTDLDSQLMPGSGWEIGFVGGINNAGVITAYACRVGSDDNCATVSLDPTGGNGLPPVTAPVPEPATYAMLLAGLSLTGWRARRRRG